jgi:hypothetical protein
MPLNATGDETVGQEKDQWEGKITLHSFHQLHD